MKIASSCGWWIFSAFLLVNEIVGSSIPLVLGDRPESWTFCTTLRYVFFDLEDCPVEVPPMITLISPSGGHDDSSIFPFNFSFLWSLPTKYLNFPYLNTRPCHAHDLYGSDNIYSYCACWDLLSSSPATLRKGHLWFAWALDWVEHLRACSFDFFLKTSSSSYYLGLSYLPFVPSLDEDLA